MKHPDFEEIYSLLPSSDTSSLLGVEPGFELVSLRGAQHSYFPTRCWLVGRMAMVCLNVELDFQVHFCKCLAYSNTLYKTEGAEMSWVTPR